MAERCSNWRKRCSARCPSVQKIGFALNILSLISSAVTIIYFGAKLSSLRDYDYIYSYKPAICTPVTGYALEVNCTDNPTIRKWIAVMVTDKKQTLVENPFEIRGNRVLAIQDRDHMMEHSNYTCLCSAVNTNGNKLSPDGSAQCSIWADCILDIQFMRYIQRDNNRYYHTYISFIIASAVSVVISILAIPTGWQSIKAAKTEYVALD